MEKVVIATHNPHKLIELRTILSAYGLEVTSLGELGISDDVEETGTTFIENARIKAKAALDKTGLVAVADDSGLMVDALDGAPGVYSARYAGEGGTAEMCNQKLLKELLEVPDEKRTARFVSAICMLWPDGRELTAEGTCEGRILRAPKGENGFGYDPLFYVPSFDKSMAELDPETKNRISHRANALKELDQKLQSKAVHF